MIFVQSEATAARRRVHLFLVDATDGITAETGEAGGQPQLSKNGAAWANTSATLSAIGNGAYYVELTAAELDTLGHIGVRYKSANTTERFVEHDVVAVNVQDTVRAGLTALPNAVAGANNGLPLGDANADVTVAGFAAAALTAINGEVVDALATDTYAEPSAVPAATCSLKDKINWIFLLARNKRIQTSSLATVRNDADSANVATATVADDTTQFVQNKWT